MLIAFAPHTRVHEEPRGPTATARPPVESPTKQRARGRAGRILGRVATASWLALVAYYLLYAKPPEGGGLGSELTALLALGGWAFMLAALAHHANGRSERRTLEHRARALTDLLDRSRSWSTGRTRGAGDRGPTVH